MARFGGRPVYDVGMWTRALALSIVLAAASSPSTAQAAVADLNPLWVGIGVGIPYLTISTILIAESLDDAIQRGHGLAEAGAIFEVIWGSTLIAAGSVLGAVFLGFSTQCYNCDWTEYATIAGLIGVPGIPYLLHGIWSLTDGRPPDVNVSVAFGPEGVRGSVVGSF